MWQQNVSQVLAHMGWGSGYRLPIANDENLALERELEKIHRVAQQKATELRDTEGHNEILEKTIRHATDHIFHESKFVSAKSTEVKAETEFCNVSQKEVEKLLREYKAEAEAWKKLATQNLELAEEIGVRKDALQELADLIEFDRQAMIALERKAEDQNEFLNMVEELTDQDADALKKYETRYHKMSRERLDLRTELASLLSNTHVLQSDFDGLVDQFRRLHKERGEIVKMWKETLNSLTVRDEDMAQLAGAYAEAEAEQKKINAKIEDESGKYHGSKRSSAVALSQVERWDRRVFAIRDNIRLLTELKQALGDDVLSYETEITQASSQLQGVVKKVSTSHMELETINANVAKVEAQIFLLRTRAEDDTTVSISEKSEELNKLLDKEEDYLEELRRRTEREMVRKSLLMDKRYSLQYKIFDMGHKIQTNQTNVATISREIMSSGHILERRQQIIYRLEMEFMTFDVRYKSASIPTYKTAEEYDGRQSYSDELDLLLKKISKQKNHVIVQLRHITEVNKKIYRDKVLDLKEIEDVQGKLNEVRGQSKMASIRLKALGDEHQNTIVDHSLLAVKLHHFQKALMARRNELYDVEHYRILIHAASKEKRAEIDTHARLLETQKRNLNECLSQLRHELSETNSSLLVRKQRYEHVMRLMGGPSDEEEDFKSEALIVIKMTQEREWLRQEGDKWDIKVKEAEAETEALQNSLGVIQCSNDLFRDSLKPPKDDQYHQQLDGLKEDELKLRHAKYMMQSKVKKITTELELKSHAAMNAGNQRNFLESKRMDREYELRVIQGELHQQVLSGKRARTLTNRLLAQLAFSTPEEKEVVSLDIKVKATRRKFEFSLHCLAKFLNMHPPMYEVLTKMLDMKFGEEVAVKFLKKVTPLVSVDVVGSGSLPSLSSASGSEAGSSRDRLKRASSLRKESLNKDDERKSRSSRGSLPPLSLDKDDERKSRASHPRSSQEDNDDESRKSMSFRGSLQPLSQDRSDERKSRMSRGPLPPFDQDKDDERKSRGSFQPFGQDKDDESRKSRSSRTSLPSLDQDKEDERKSMSFRASQSLGDDGRKSRATKGSLSLAASTSTTSTKSSRDSMQMKKKSVSRPARLSQPEEELEDDEDE